GRRGRFARAPSTAAATTRLGLSSRPSSAPVADRSGNRGGLIIMRHPEARALVATLLLFLLLPLGASAHERRDVGKLQFVVGWIGEPSLLGEPNGIDLRISDKATGNPIEGAEKTLKASVAFGGGQPKEFPLRARFGQKGAYTADIIPTKAGSYVFTFSGTVGDQ